MHAYKLELKQAHYKCEGCELWFPHEEPLFVAWVEPSNLPDGGVRAEDILDFAQERVLCHDTPPCHGEEYMALEEGDVVWICGSCDEWYREDTEAAECCQ